MIFTICKNENIVIQILYTCIVYYKGKDYNTECITLSFIHYHNESSIFLERLEYI